MFFRNNNYRNIFDVFVDIEISGTPEISRYKILTGIKKKILN